MTILTLAANILDISEYTVLEHAYQQWYGRSASIDFINRTFSNYLVTQEPPYWARHYARSIITSFDAETRANYIYLHYFWMLSWGVKPQIIQAGNSLPA